MENIVFTQLSIAEVKQLFRQELEAFFAGMVSPISHAESEEIGGIELAQEITGLARPTIYGLVSQSKIPSMKKGKKLYFSRQELTTWIKEGRRKTVSEIEMEADDYIARKGKGAGR